MTFSVELFKRDFNAIRQSSPLVHNITNYVAMNLSANVLLAAGASPIMSSEPEEIADLAASSDALVVNIGCLEQGQIAAMRLAAEAAHRQGKPWVLDPVGAGASRLRTETALELARSFRPTVIRGNASEIMALAGSGKGARGVDSAHDSAAALEYAVQIASALGTIVSISGPTDFITDGHNIIAISNGSPLMPKVSALGCAASALTAAFAAVGTGHALAAAAGAMALMGIAGEVAAQHSAGPGSLAVNFIDTLSSLDPEEAAGLIKFKEQTYSI